MADRGLGSVLVGCIDEEDLEFIRPICSALLKIDIHLIPDVNTLLTEMQQRLEPAILPSVWHFVLSSVGCAEEKLSRLNEYITHPYNINQDFEFGLMLTMTKTVKEMDTNTFNNYKSNVGLPKAPSKEKFLYDLYKEDRLTRESAPLLRECIETTGCLEFHEPLTVFCGEHSIQVPEIVYIPDSDEGSNDRDNDKKIRARFILSTCILITIILIMATVALIFLFIYKNTQHFDAQNISVYKGYVTSIYYDQFYVNKVNLISDGLATASVYVVPKSQLSYILVVLPEKQIDKRNSTFSQRFELYYNRSENNLICNTVCELNFRFELQENGVVSDCPAQLFLYDNKTDLEKVFKPNEPHGSVGHPVAQTDCLPKTGVMNKRFQLPPNKLYYIGWYVAKNVGYTIWLSANLTRINISGLNENCSVSSQHTTCPITHAKYPHRKENISLLFNTTSTTMMDVNVTPVLVQWNLQRLIGVSAPSCIGVVVLMVVVSVLFYYCMIRPVARSGYSTIA